MRNLRLTFCHISSISIVYITYLSKWIVNVIFRTFDCWTFEFASWSKRWYKQHVSRSTYKTVLTIAFQTSNVARWWIVTLPIRSTVWSFAELISFEVAWRTGKHAISFIQRVKARASCALTSLTFLTVYRTVACLFNANVVLKLETLGTTVTFEILDKFVVSCASQTVWGTFIANSTISECSCRASFLAG